MTRLVLLAVLVPGLALGDVEEDDKLCEVIAQSPGVSIPPRDRLWFKEHCTCSHNVCGQAGSRRFRERLAAARRAGERASRLGPLLVEVRGACRALLACYRDTSRRTCSPEKRAWRQACARVPRSAHAELCQGDGSVKACGETYVDREWTRAARTTTPGEEAPVLGGPDAAGGRAELPAGNPLRARDAQGEHGALGGRPGVEPGAR